MSVRLTASVEKLDREVREKKHIDVRQDESERINAALRDNKKLQEMTQQTKQMNHLVQTLNEALALLERLKGLQEIDLEELDYELHKLQKELPKLQAAIDTAKKNEYEDILREVQRLSRKVNVELDEAE